MCDPSYDFTDPPGTPVSSATSTRTSPKTPKRYALLQTPEFVEEFILDRTLKPAIDEFGLEPGPPRAQPDLPDCG